MTEKIDFIIPWVDSNDINWRKKRDLLLNRRIDSTDENVGDERFRDSGILKYLLRSIEKYANWVNHIYLITDNQMPSWLSNDVINSSQTKSKLVVIDHTEIILDKYLPSFNSNAIEFNVLNIPNLTEHFVMFNDDFLINDYVSPDDFFINGLPRDYRIYKPLRPYSDYDHILFNNNQLINHWIRGKFLSKKGLFSRSYGKQLLKNIIHYFLEGEHWVSNYSFPHNAQSFTKTTFQEVLTKWHDEIEKVKENQFRSNDDLSILLVRDYMLELGKFVPRSPNFSQYYKMNDVGRIQHDLEQKNHKLICINDAETNDYQKIVKALDELLMQCFSEKSSFEK